ncbi:TnsA endonuclease N-terminal domain-containing protein [Cytobacillus firmus]|uniref:TnsA endonuclease N-terminal domain-containing protein n=1 Tax=Cytobacillus firmus TaxID=1399 RepID=UPI0018CC8826|nr:TnsA endonuclease N-terminal domain-containing protein [Cytobacillus firmus]MBG9656278.1 Tn7 transposition protein A [Cytobacillus firmus]MED1904558.1 TnsA endonuclease N-terminal domain-containing protein [Cytobacillus firmus]
MAKRKTELTEKKIAELEKEGRGQGQGENYKPWLTIQDVPSIGVSTRGKGWKTNRIHQFLSKLERDYFYVLEWNDLIVDIREQFPLNREDTLHLANEKGIKHPTDPKSQIPIVMTTDFLITVKSNGGTTHVARTIKPSKELENDRTIEKFEIERAYWESRGIDWGVITEKEIPKDMVENVEWLHLSYYEIEELPISTLNTYCQHMKSFIKKYNTSIIEMVTEFDQTFQLEVGMGLEILKHLIARKEVEVDITKKIYTHLWIEDAFKLDSLLKKEEINVLS